MIANAGKGRQGAKKSCSTDEKTRIHLAAENFPMMAALSAGCSQTANIFSAEEAHAWMGTAGLAWQSNIPSICLAWFQEQMRIFSASVFSAVHIPPVLWYTVCKSRLLNRVLAQRKYCL